MCQASLVMWEEANSHSHMFRETICYVCMVFTFYFCLLQGKGAQEDSAVSFSYSKG